MTFNPVHVCTMTEPRGDPQLMVAITAIILRQLMAPPSSLRSGPDGEIALSCPSGSQGSLQQPRQVLLGGRMTVSSSCVKRGLHPSSFHTDLGTTECWAQGSTTCSFRERGSVFGNPHLLPVDPQLFIHSHNPLVTKLKQATRMEPPPTPGTCTDSDTYTRSEML